MVKIDWAMTEDGDLALGDPEINQQGEILYKHIDGTIDTDKGEDGKEFRDIGIAYDLEAEKQVVLNRIRTDAPDWFHHPAMGGNLTDLIGEPNTRETGLRGVAFIEKALTYKGLYHTTQLSVRPVPISPSEIVFLIDISKYNSPVFRLPLVFNLESGLMDIYESPKPSEGV